MKTFLIVSCVAAMSILAARTNVDVPCAVCGRPVIQEPALARLVPKCEGFTGFVHPGQCLTKQDPQVIENARAMYK